MACNECGETGKPSYKSTPTICMDCQRARAKRSRTTERGRNWSREYSKMRYQKHREKYLARARVKLAVRLGTISKPGVCQRCSEESPLQAHHPDYSRPLEVLWLCEPCHIKVHNRAANLIAPKKPIKKKGENSAEGI